MPEERTQTQPPEADSPLARMVKAFDRIATSITMNLGILCFTVMLIVILINVVLRYVLKIPNMWGEEIARYLMVWGVYLGVACGCRARAHMAMDIVVDHLPKALSKVVQIAVRLVVLGLYALLLYYSMDMTLQTRATGQVSPAMNIGMWIIYLGLDVSFLLGLVIEIMLFINDFIVKKKFLAERADGGDPR